MPGLASGDLAIEPGPRVAVTSTNAAPEHEETYRSLIEAVVDLAIFRLSADGTIETWNPGAARIKRYAATDVLGRSFAIFYTDEDRAAGRPAAALAAAAANGRFEGEGWRLRADGTRFWAHVVIDAIFDADGAVAGFAKITRDATARLELERAREQLAEAQRLEIVGQLTGGVAHDFNNILTAVLGCLDLVRETVVDERVRRVVAGGVVAASRGQALVAQLLAFARRQVLRPARTDLNAVIAALEPLLARALGEQVLLSVDLASDAPAADLDQAQFQSALLNLALNARDAMPDGGALFIRTIRVDAADALGGAPAVLVIVEDDGVGMDAATRERAVEPFFTTKPPGKGSGLGLSQVHGFAAQSGGAMEIDSAPGEGTRIRLVLPAAATQPLSSEAPRRRVLLVEDDDIVRTMASTMLAERALDLVTASDGDQALAILEREGEFDLLFSDIVMPGCLDGVALAREARRLRPGIAVLLTSGYPRDALPAGGVVPPGTEFLPKPYRAQAVHAAFDRALRQPAASSGAATSDCDGQSAQPLL